MAASLKTECVRMKLPVKDPAEFFRSRSVEEFRALIPRKLALAPQQPEKSTTVDGQEVFLRSDDFTFKARLLTERGGKFRALVVLEDANQKTLSDTFDLRSRKSRVSFARNLLGRSYLDEGNPREAASWFLQNYQADKKGDRAPDSLLYLAESMRLLKDTKRACVALDQFAREFPTEAGGRLKAQYTSTKSKLTCG